MFSSGIAPSWPQRLALVAAAVVVAALGLSPFVVAQPRPPAEPSAPAPVLCPAASVSPDVGRATLDAPARCETGATGSAPSGPPKPLRAGPSSSMRLASGDEPLDSGAAAPLAPLQAVTRSLSKSLGSLLQKRPSSPPAPVHHIPIAGSLQEDRLKLSNRDGLITLIARDASLNEILSLLARSQGLNVVASNDMDAHVSMTLENVSLENVLNSVLSVAGYTWFERNGIVHVTSVDSGSSLPPDVQGLQLRVFELDYTAAADLESSVAAMLSPLGKSFTVASEPTDNRRTREAVVVEDLPERVERVSRYIAQMDQPPQQVLIEVHILAVDLEKETRHGVDYQHLFRLLHRDIEIDWTGFANPAAPTAMFFRLDGNDVTGLIECLENSTDAKTLASPRVLALNGQLARIQIGQQLGFRITTTTETSTMESVDFLDVGILMEVTPRITRDNRILMQIHPEVSSGQINPDTGLPEEETTEVTTNVMLRDGQGVVLGGLISEKDSNIQSKLPILGDLYLIGKLFQKRQLIKTRTEIIVVLVPRIVPFDPETQEMEDMNVMRARTPLLEGPLMRYPRPWEPQLPDALTNPTLLRLPPVAAGLLPQFRRARCQPCAATRPSCAEGEPPPAALEHAGPVLHGARADISDDSLQVVR